jgi:homoserine dehydrogenase
MSNKLNIAIAGLGTVGVGVFKILTREKELISRRTGREIEIVAVSAQNKDKDRGIDLSNIQWLDNAVDLASLDNADLLVELVGGSDGTAKSLAEATLKNGKHFVTANKALIAKHGFNLAELAEKNNCSLLFDAAVAGGVPVLKTIKEGLVANNISKISGILNGTCNFIISVMSKTGRAFDDVLREAQDKGYAEADPSFDIDGIDTAHKLTILSSLCFGTKPAFNKAYIEGIRNLKIEDINFAKKLGFSIKLLGVSNILDNKEVELRVHPTLISQNHELANVEDALGGIKVECDALGPLVMTGAGAGMYETASSVIADICDVAAERKTFPLGISVKNLEQAGYSEIEDHSGEYYLRFEVKDEDGVLSSMASLFSKHGVGFGKVTQEAIDDKSANVILLTHKETEKYVVESLKDIEKEDYCLSKPIMIRIER